MKLVDLIPLKEIDFKNQDQFDDYQKQHSLRPDTKVTIAGKPTTAGQAAKNSEPTKGASVFGKDSGASVFGKTGGASTKPDGMATVNAIAAGTGLRAQAVAGWADENGVNLSKVAADLKSKKLKPMDMMTAVVGKPGNKYAKDIIAKYSQQSEPKLEPGPLTKFIYGDPNKEPDVVAKPVGNPDLSKFEFADKDWFTKGHAVIKTMYDDNLTIDDLQKLFKAKGYGDVTDKTLADMVADYNDDEDMQDRFKDNGLNKRKFLARIKDLNSQLQSSGTSTKLSEMLPKKMK
jgi:hypothetical protein